MRSIVIVGGGVSGLTLAYRVATTSAGRRRADPRSGGAGVGGKIETTTRAGFRVRRTVPTVSSTRNPQRSLCARNSACRRNCCPASESAGRNALSLSLNGKLQRLPNSYLSFITSRVLSWRAKYRLLTEAKLSSSPHRRRRIHRRVRAPPSRGRDRGQARRRDGDRHLCGRSEVAEHAGVVSWAVGTVRARTRQRAGWHGGGRASSRRGWRPLHKASPTSEPARMWSLTAGLGTLGRDAARAASANRRSPGSRCGRLERTETGWRVHGDGNDHWEASVVVLTCPAYEQAALLADLDAELAERVGGIAYNRVAVVALGYRASDMPLSLDGFGYLSPQRERRDVLGVQWCSSIFPGRRAPDGTVLLPKGDVRRLASRRAGRVGRRAFAASRSARGTGGGDGLAGGAGVSSGRALAAGDSAVSCRPSGARRVDRRTDGTARGVVPRGECVSRRGVKRLR